MTEHWDKRFLQLASQIASWSKDPSRGVGCVIVSSTKQIISTGFNGLPRGIVDSAERLERPIKYDIVCHAEMNALIQCARNAVSPVGCTLYSSFSPCVQCSLAIIQAGIVLVVTNEMDAQNDQPWSESVRKAKDLFREGGVEYRAYPTE
ncbi:MAG: dCMP deaminase family protein [Phycisphaerales bacterium]|nr:dCMP deaminase family protein [Phycisphaerales bacterium]